jgi:hypothetical protein
MPLLFAATTCTCFLPWSLCFVLSNVHDDSTKGKFGTDEAPEDVAVMRIKPVQRLEIGALLGAARALYQPDKTDAAAVGRDHLQR